MTENLSLMLNQLDMSSIKASTYLVIMSIAQTSTKSSSNNTGIIIMGMIIVIVGLVGFTITKNKK
ncbi:MAG: hypothetical protein RSA10_03995 [Bacilli bacterium]